MQGRFQRLVTPWKQAFVDAGDADAGIDLVARAKKAIPGQGVYTEEDPHAFAWIYSIKPSRRSISRYVAELFPSTKWIRRYNRHWLANDLISGLTIGLVVVPQGIAYALLARLTPEYGLYTSFVGAALYWIFGTSKDIVIGTTIVGSLLIGSAVTSIEESHPGQYTPEEVAKALSLMSGAVLLFLGFARLGWLLDFIPYIPISAFVTAASITIMSTQLPMLLGIPDINTRNAPYRVFIDTFKGLQRTRLDAAIGLTALTFLFVLKSVCTKIEQRQAQRKRLWTMLSSIRMAVTVLLFTFVSWIVNRHADPGATKFRIVGKMEQGFRRAAVPHPSTELVGLIVADLPAIVIILIIEHIAIAKSFGRVFNYQIQPSQEIVALGAANIFSPFVGGYVCTGSFGASAVLANSGVRTPLAGLFSSGVVVLALYALTSVFRYIPMASLSALVLHATFNLIARPTTLYKYWRLSPLELVIWIIGVVVAIFTSLETSIYTTTAVSAVLLLLRMSRSKGYLLGQVEIFSTAQEVHRMAAGSPSGSSPAHNSHLTSQWDAMSRQTFISLERQDYTNPKLKVDSPYAGVFIYRFPEGLNYTNQNLHMAEILRLIKERTRPTCDDDGTLPHDRLWNDPGPDADGPKTQDRPLLRAIILDCSSINNVDITSVQGLVDIRNSLAKYAAPERVEWHFASLNNSWARRALTVAGFGVPAGLTKENLQEKELLYLVAALEPKDNDSVQDKGDLEHASTSTDSAIVRALRKRTDLPGKGTIGGVNRPHFHVDLLGAVKVAVRDAKRREGMVLDSGTNQ
ncbi:sulfate transporter family-domain-containing protein [Elsinoe ampelina]|uniref:Sulfate transporter family-domain-containing protein n=1 Tax=Elsinoe ampelina TaxID=302913 RepID=A0A6A6GKJ1_9PEZI|nr:sulfate transporter family-domain-containing protein [Elsinoe ampelina]